MGKETELKYSPPESFLPDALFGCEYIAPYSDAPRIINMRTEYLDSLAADAKAQGITLRRRFENGESIIYAKCGKSASGALSVRSEWSIASEDVKNCAKLLAKVGAPTDKLFNIPLHICASVEFVRRECLVTPHHGFSFMLSYDDGFFANDKSMSFREIELELVDGSASELRLFGEKLAAKLRLSPEPLSKYARALNAETTR